MFCRSSRRPRRGAASSSGPGRVKPQHVVDESLLVWIIRDRDKAGCLHASVARFVVLLHTTDERLDPITATEQSPDRGKRRCTDASTTPRRCDHQRERGGAVLIDLRVDECHGLSIESRDPAGTVAHRAAAMLMRWVGDQTQKVLRPFASSEPANGLGIVEPRSDRAQEVGGERAELYRPHALRRASASAVVGAHFTF